MKSHSLKPFDDGKYLSEEDALKLLESIPIPKDDLEKSDPLKVKSNNSPQEDNLPVDLGSKIIDLNPADNGNLHSIDGWLNYFAVGKETMVSMPDIYLAGKSNNQALLNSLRKDFTESWIVTNTRIKYENDQNAIITHHLGSKLIPPVEYKIVVPEYSATLLDGVLGTNEGLRFLQALFGTKDNAYWIGSTLHKLSYYSLDKIKFRSALLSNRPIERVSGLQYSNGRCNVYTDLVDRNFGRSRGMHINTPPKNGGAP